MRNRVSVGDTVGGVAPTAVPNAKVEIHKVGLNSTAPAAGDSASLKLQDLGVVATVTADASGKFEYVLSDPSVVKSGRPPMITYQLTITPPPGSSLAARSGIQVFFMEQFPGRSTCGELLLAPQEVTARSATRSG